MPAQAQSCYNRGCSADHQEVVAVPCLDACIRTAVPGDAAGLAALARRVFVATYGAAIPAPTLQRYLHTHMAPRHFHVPIAAGTLFVALKAGRLAGYARIHAALPPACVGDRRAIELAQLYVDITEQGRGLGVQLLAAVAAAVATPIWLCAWEQNQRAMRFYIDHGFIVVGQMAVHIREIIFNDLVLVRRPIELAAEGAHD